jgi:hypothetical protein
MGTARRGGGRRMGPAGRFLRSTRTAQWIGRGHIYSFVFFLSPPPGLAPDRSPTARRCPFQTFLFFSCPEFHRRFLLVFVFA